MSPGRVVTPLPCGQLGTINGDAVLMFVISCPAHYVWQMRRAITESALSADFWKKIHLFTPCVHRRVILHGWGEGPEGHVVSSSLRKEERKCIRRIQNDPKSWFSLRLLHEWSAESPDPQSGAVRIFGAVKGSECVCAASIEGRGWNCPIEPVPRPGIRNWESSCKSQLQFSFALQVLCW